ncbi:MAG: hypothetical protein ACJ8HJ_16410, partial [Massilia sp.]
MPDHKSLILLTTADLPTARLLRNQQRMRPSLFKPAHRPRCADCNTAPFLFAQDFTFPAAARRHDIDS